MEATQGDIQALEYEIFKNLKYNLSTLRLLSASIVVAFSGACRLHISFLMLDIEPNLIIYLAGFLIIYATYTLDRSSGCKEDRINRRELNSSNKLIAILISVLAFSAGAYLFAQFDLLFVAFLPFLIGYIYSNGMQLSTYSLKIKGNLGIKNLVVALTWGISIAAIAQHWSRDAIALFSIFSFFTLKSFINTIIYDFRDVEGDAIAGLKTLPIYWGEKKAKNILQILHHSLHFWIFIAMLFFISSQFIILFTCWLAGLIYISFLAKPAGGIEPRVRKVARDILVDGEFILAVCLKMAFDFLLLAI
ncbi:MAG: UbiA family prenyltransferase [Methanocellales archaeon]